MKSKWIEHIEGNWFFAALLGFVFVLPFSPALVSVFGGALLTVSLIEDSWQNKIQRLKQKKVLLVVSLIFIIYLVSSLLTLDGVRPFYDVKKAMFYFALPIAFVFGKEINARQKRIVFYCFIVSVFLATVITIIRWRLYPDTTNFSIHTASPVSHIRFSFQVILVFWFLFYFSKHNLSTFSLKKRIGILLLTAYFVLFLLLQQSLTGLAAWVGSLAFFVFYQLFSNNSKHRTLILSIGVFLLLLPPVYLSYVVHKFYDFEEVSKDSIEIKTSKGNNYSHDFHNLAVENGNFVYLYVCEEEMQEAWNERSNFKYDEPGKNGYPIYATLMRYLTSKGLRKDAEGVNSLSQKDIEHIENGMANYIFQKKFSLYPRIYQTVWEYHIYSTTSNPNNQSFSQRIEFARAAITIIRENFWLGVGTGNWRTEFEKAYVKNESQLNKESYSSAHNQYLNYWVKFGLLGLAVILFIMAYPIVQTKRYTDILFLTFIVFMLFANFADSNFESHMGSSFFVFFYCIFLTGERNYFHIGNTEKLVVDKEL